MCGEGISRKGLGTLNLGDVDTLRNRVHTVKEHWPGNIETEATIDGFILDRPGLLRRLRERMGDGVQGLAEDVVKVEPKNEGFVIEGRSGIEHLCRIVIGADGARSVVRRDLFDESPPWSLTVEQYVLDEPQEPDTLDLLYDVRYRGKYRWRFPHGKLTKVGFPCGSDRPPENALEKHSRTIPIGPLPYLVKGGACLIGDAACHANPITFGGLSNAFVAARILADAIESGSLDHYQMMWRSHPRSDPVFFQAFEILRSANNAGMAQILSPLRFGASANLIMQGLMADERFRTVYRAQMLKADIGW
jgi:digeranylgeranylglycerophospholipid reductase